MNILLKKKKSIESKYERFWEFGVRIQKKPSNEGIKCKKG